MNTLAQWQSELAAVIDGNPSALPDTAPAPGLDVERGCQVYRGSSRAARFDALVDVYAVCRRVLGERSFDGLAGEFVRRVASGDADLNRFGDGFAGFLDEVVAQHAAFAALPWLPGLAQLEWSCHQVYYAADHQAPNLGLLSDGDPSLLVLRPTRALAWQRHCWPVHRIWQVHQDSDDPPRILVDPGDWCLVIERSAYQARVVEVDAALWQLLAACGRGLDLAAMAADSSLDVARLGSLLEQGWIGAIEHA